VLDEDANRDPRSVEMFDDVRHHYQIEAVV